MSKNQIVEKDKKFIDKMFPSVNGVNKNLLKVTNEGVYSMSGINGSAFMADIIIKHMGTRDIIITDGTGNNGSETIIYSLLFREVNSIEMDDVNFDALSNNVKTYNLKNVNLIKGDTTIELGKTKQDVIVIDAPWGGPDYKKYPNVKLFMGGIELADIVNKYMGHTKLFVLKVPKNYDFNNFIKNIGNISGLSIYNYIIPEINKLSYRVIAMVSPSYKSPQADITVGAHSINIINKSQTMGRAQYYSKYKKYKTKVAAQIKKTDKSNKSNKL